MDSLLRPWVCVAFFLLLGTACGGGSAGGAPPSSQPQALSNVKTAADSNWGVRQLSLPYQVSATGLLVVSISWYEGTPANTPTFGGAGLTLVAQGQTTIARLRVVHGAMYYLPVTAGQTGSVQVTFPADARRVSITAATIPGATSLVGGQTSLANTNPSPLGLSTTFSLTGQSTVITLLSSSAAIDSIVTGTGHTRVSNPTQPLAEFHDARSYTGYASLAAGSHTLGYAQDPASAAPSPNWLYDAVMVAGIFR